MVKRLLALGFIILIILITGCIDSTTTIAVRKDGSGLIMQTTYFSGNIEKIMQSMVQDLGVGDTLSLKSSFEDKPIDMVKYRAKALQMGEGVTLVSAKRVRKDDGSPGERIIYAFEDVRKLTVRVDPENPASENAALMISKMKKSDRKGEPIRFDFLPGETPRLYIFLPDEDEDSEEDKKSKKAPAEEAAGENIDDSYIELFRDFRVCLNVKVMESEIIKTNATYLHTGLDHSKYQYVTLFDMNFNEIIENREEHEELSKMENMDVLTAVDMYKDIPGFKIDPRKKIEIVFQ